MWGLRQIRVTLQEDATGEEVIIEQGPDGKVSAAPARSKAKPAAESTDTKARTSGKAKGADDKGDEADKSRRNATAAKKVDRARKARSRQPPKSLVWSPVQDNGYHGFSAPSGGGKFKLLKAQSTQWALFFEVRGADARKVGCFGNETKGKVRAQELHDQGWPASEKRGEVTAADLESACPLPNDEKKKERKVKKPETKTDAAPKQPTPEPTPPPSAAPPSKTAEQDRELLSSFSAEADSVLDEDEDD